MSRRSNPSASSTSLGRSSGGGTRQSDDYRYRFPPQEHKIDVGSEVHDPEITEGETRTGSVVGLDEVARTVDIRRRKGWAGRHPEAIVPLKYIGAKAQQQALMRIGGWIADNGIDRHFARVPGGPRAAPAAAASRWPAAGADLAGPGESGSDAALRLATFLDGTTLRDPGPTRLGQDLLRRADDPRAGARRQEGRHRSQLAQGDLEPARRRRRRRREGARDQFAECRRSMATTLQDAYVECVKDNDKVFDALAADEVDVVGGTPGCGRG